MKISATIRNSSQKNDITVSTERRTRIVKKELIFYMKHITYTKHILMVSFLLFPMGLMAQSATDSTINQSVILIAESEPSFPGGKMELFAFIGKHIKYPKDALKKDKEGVVVVSFVVERDGTIKSESIKIEQSVYPSLDEEAIRIIKLMPNWIPANHDDRTVRAKTGIPIQFKLK